MWTCTGLILRYTKKCIGPLAQLGERLLRMQEVVGSNPVGSILILSKRHSVPLNKGAEWRFFESDFMLKI